MAFRVRRARRFVLGVDLQDGRSGDDVFVREIGGRFGEDDVDLAHGTRGDGVDLVVFVAGRDADLDWELEWSGKGDISMFVTRW